MWQGNEEEDLFSSIDKASVKGQRLPYLLPKSEEVDGEAGLYIVEVDEIKILRSRQQRIFYLVEMVIHVSNVDARPPGLRVSWMTEMTGDMGPINIKRFLGALVGFTDEDDIDANVTSNDGRLSVDPSQPFRYCRAFVQVRKILTKGKKEEFSEHRWEPAQGFTLGDILTLRDQGFVPEGSLLTQPAIG